jgi:hypothetical protein
VHLQPAGGDHWCPRRLQRHGRGDLQLLGRRPLCRQDQPQAHGGAGRVAAAASRGTPRASCDAAGPVEFGGSLYRCHRILLRPSDSGSGGGLLVHAQPRGGTSRWPGRGAQDVGDAKGLPAALARASPTHAPALPLHTLVGTDLHGYHPPTATMPPATSSPPDTVVVVALDVANAPMKRLLAAIDGGNQGVARRAGLAACIGSSRRAGPDAAGCRRRRGLQRLALAADLLAQRLGSGSQQLAQLVQCGGMGLDRAAGMWGAAG